MMARMLMIMLLLAAGGAIWKTLGATPAFNPALVSETVVGQGHTGMVRAMYDKGYYDYQRGYAFLMAETLISGETEGRNEVAPRHVLWSRAAKGRAALSSAVAQDPGNAHAWAQLAWSHARLGDRNGAWRALVVSWDVAPFNRTLADTRLNLAGLLTRREAPSGAAASAIARDMEVLGRYEPRRLRFFLGVYPNLEAMAPSTAEGSAD